MLPDAGRTQLHLVPPHHGRSRRLDRPTVLHRGWSARTAAHRTVPWSVQPNVGSLATVATRMKLDPELQAVVERARVLARERGELRDGPGAPPSDGLSPAVRAAVADWVDSGDYDRAVAEIVADDPDLQTQ